MLGNAFTHSTDDRLGDVTLGYTRRERSLLGRDLERDGGLILGKSVRSNADEDMGRIVDIIVSRDGQARAAVIDFGGFLGIGTRKIAVDWRALNFAPAGKPAGTIIVDLTRNQVRLAPEYKRGEPVVVVSSASPGRTAPSSEAAAPER